MIWIVIFISVSLGALGQILMKIAMNRTGSIPLPFLKEVDSLSNVWKFLKSMVFYYTDALLSVPMVLAVGAYLLSYAIWLGLLSRYDLTFIRPFVSLGYIIVIMYGFMSGENMSTERVAGIVLICIGLIFVARSAGSP